MSKRFLWSNRKTVRHKTVVTPLLMCQAIEIFSSDLSFPVIQYRTLSVGITPVAASLATVSMAGNKPSRTPGLIWWRCCRAGTITVGGPSSRRSGSSRLPTASMYSHWVTGRIRTGLIRGWTHSVMRFILPFYVAIAGK